MPLPLADRFLSSARTARDLIDRPDMADRWVAVSAGAAMTVGGSADHLATHIGTTFRLLAADPSDVSAFG